MSIKKVIKSTCGICECGCGVLIHVEDGRLSKITGDPQSPVNKGVLCAKGYASFEYLNHPDRILHPLKRVGKRGGGKWQKVSWDEGLECVAEGLNRVRDTYGVESVLFMRGGTRGISSDYLTRFANAFGTPNISSMASVCWIPTERASQITLGFLPFPDHVQAPACVLVWGCNLRETAIGRYAHLLQAMNQGAKLIVVDPVRIDLAGKADAWLQVRPGSDLALALGMIHVIVDQELYDKKFVRNWTVGFEELVAHVKAYTPERVAKITWVDAETIRNAARLYATNGPAFIQWGNGIEHNINSFQTARALAILKALTGNIGIPGGEIFYAPLPSCSRTSREFTLMDNIPKEIRAKRISAGDMLLPTVFYALPQTIIKAILKGTPYPVRAAYVLAGNNLLSFSNIPETNDAFQQLDFLAVADMFMTPTASLADIILPVATYLEFDSLNEAREHPVITVQQKVAEVGECRSDYQILCGLAKKLGIGKYFWETEVDCLDYLLGKNGMTFSELRKSGAISARYEYKSYEKNGFQTPSGKVELYSQQMKDWGFEPLPTYHEPPESPYSSPELMHAYPLTFTSYKTELYRHTEGRQIPSLRSKRPEPITLVNPETAEKLGIKEGDWVYVETRRGRIRQKASLIAAVDPRTVVVDYGWWYPEKASSDLWGRVEANINMLTDNKPPWGREMGTPNLRGILCKLYKDPNP